MVETGVVGATRKGSYYIAHNASWQDLGQRSLWGGIAVIRLQLVKIEGRIYRGYRVCTMTQ